MRPCVFPCRCERVRTDFRTRSQPFFLPAKILRILHTYWTYTDVNHLHYLNREGVECDGPHWSRAEVVAATNGMKFHSKVNDWDKYVAFNSMYADLCAEMTDEEILKAAYLFYFNDKDWQPDEDDCTKIWDYTSAHATM